MTRAEKDTAALNEFITKMDANRAPKFWEGLIEEELKEVEQALADLLKEFADLRYVITGLMVTTPLPEVVKVFERLEPRLARVTAMVEEKFIDLGDEAFDRVHASNMSKLDDNGQPIRRESDGKILKGPNYAPPVLIDLITNPSK